MNAEIGKILTLPDIRARFETIGVVPVVMKPSEMKAFLQKDSDRWAEVIKERGIKVE